MLKKAGFAALTLGLASCGTVSSMAPGVLPGSETGTLELVNTQDEPYIIALNRCGEGNQNTAIEVNGRNGLLASAGETVSGTLSVGCYIGYLGPNRMTMNTKSLRFTLPSSAEGTFRVYSDGRAEVVKD